MSDYLRPDEGPSDGFGGDLGQSGDRSMPFLPSNSRGDRGENPSFGASEDVSPHSYSTGYLDRVIGQAQVSSLWAPFSGQCSTSRISFPD